LTSISADLGTLKAPWVAWCAQHQLTPSDALRQVLTKLLGQTPPVRAVVGTTVAHRAERVTKRMELRLTPSEHAALVARAKADGSHPSTWVVAMVRTLLTQQPTLLPPERDALARSNQQLLAIGRNLNQIAKALNTSPQDRHAVRAELVTALSRRIQTHTSLVSDVLRRTLERWQIK
jgi:hypothetical protein